jgi:hypothetical protein
MAGRSPQRCCCRRGKCMVVSAALAWTSMPRGTRSGMCDRGSSGGSVVRGVRPCTSTSRMCRMRDRARFVGWRGRDAEGFSRRRLQWVTLASRQALVSLLVSARGASSPASWRPGGDPLGKHRTRSLASPRNQPLAEEGRSSDGRRHCGCSAIGLTAKCASGNLVGKRYQEFESPLARQERRSIAL